MFLNDVATLNSSQKFQRLRRTLHRDHGVSLSPYYSLSETEIKQFIGDLEIKKTTIIFESDFSDQFQNSEYVKASLLAEACRMILKEIRPKRASKNSVKEAEETTNEALNFSGEYSVFGNTDEGCSICGEDSCSCDTYAQDDETDTTDCDMLPAQDDGKFDVANSIENIGLKKIIAVYEDNEEMNTQTIKETVGSLSKLLENSLLQEGELERAELVLAMKDIAQRLQKQLEDAGKMGTEDIMPLANALRNYFSEDLATGFSQKSEMALQSLVDSLQQIKDVFENQSTQLELRISDEDAGKPTNDMIDDELSTDEIENEFGDELDDILDTDDELGLDDESDTDLELELDEPLGRARKESYSVVVDGKSFKLNEEQYKTLIAAKALTGKMQGLAEATQQATLETAISTAINPMIVLLANKKVRLTENQVRSLMFAKKFYDKTSMMGARSVRVSPSQHIMLENAKRIMRKLNEGTN